LRGFKELKTVCLNGNPFCSREDYNYFAPAHLFQVIYIDYRLVDENIRNEGLKRFEIDIGQLVNSEEVEAKSKKEKKLKEDEYEKNKVFFIFFLE
jgi:hypothetical protein